MGFDITSNVTTKIGMDYKEFAAAVRQVTGETQKMTKGFKEFASDSNKSIKKIEDRLENMSNGITTAKDGLEILKKGFEALKKGFEFMKKFSAEARDLDLAMKGTAESIGKAVALGPRFKMLMKDLSDGLGGTSDVVGTMVSGLVEGALWMRDIGESALLTSVYLAKAVGSIAKAGWKGAIKSGVKSAAAGDASPISLVKSLFGGVEAAYDEGETQTGATSGLARYKASLAARDKARRDINLGPIDLRKSRGAGKPGAASSSGLGWGGEQWNVPTVAFGEGLGGMGGEYGGPIEGGGLFEGGMGQEKASFNILGGEGATQIMSDAEEIDALLENLNDTTSSLSETWATLGDIASGVLGDLSTGLASSVMAVAKGEASWKKAMGSMAISMVDSVAEMGLARGALEFGLGFASLAVLDFAGAGNHFLSSGILLALGGGAAGVSAGITASGARGGAADSASDGSYQASYQGTGQPVASSTQNIFNIGGNVLGTKDALGMAVVDAADHVRGRGYAGAGP